MAEVHMKQTDRQTDKWARHIMWLFTWPGSQ